MEHLAALALLFALGGEPFSFRFVVQPAMAILLGLRDAKLDVKAGRPPYGLSLFERRGRRAKLEEGLRAIVIPLALAVVLDGIVQLLVDGRIRVLVAAVVGILLIGVPYVAARGLGNRVLSRSGRRAGEFR